ncbi:hypothetical protein ABZ743_32370 [Streptomyces sp. NPDC006662]|uniref:hypothetical protein n=1 Tax=Streptomyces sp. NPDC006662 TaxID=3156902 RepID=UPI0033E1BA08
MEPAQTLTQYLLPQFADRLLAAQDAQDAGASDQIFRRLLATAVEGGDDLAVRVSLSGPKWPRTPPHVHAIDAIV